MCSSSRRGTKVNNNLTLYSQKWEFQVRIEDTGIVTGRARQSNRIELEKVFLGSIEEHTINIGNDNGKTNQMVLGLD